MPGLNFSGPNLATVAYAAVDATAGASTVMNSGVQTTRISLGKYQIILPTNLAQNEGTDLVFIQAIESPGTTGRASVVDNSLSVTKLVYFWDTNPALGAATNIDTSFSVVILRSTITPPAGAPY
jgi:hypothetical protein